MSNKKKETIMAIITIILLIVLPLTGGYFIKKTACNQKSVSFDNHSYGLFQGCMVEHKGRWIPLENIRGFD